jgi:hypothetical protein
VKDLRRAWAEAATPSPEGTPDTTTTTTTEGESPA